MFARRHSEAIQKPGSPRRQKKKVTSTDRHGLKRLSHQCESVFIRGSKGCLCAFGENGYHLSLIPKLGVRKTGKPVCHHEPPYLAKRSRFLVCFAALAMTNLNCFQYLTNSNPRFIHFNFGIRVYKRLEFILRY